MGSTITLAPAARYESTFLPAGWEVKVVSGAEDADAPAPAAQLIDSNEATGEVTAIVGVTGIVDHVGDLIEPGAYTDTLAKRRPKVCWAHSWELPIGKVLRIEEWAPGDPRFAKVKATLDGKAWPAEAGALVAHMQLNMASDKGREAFAAVDFYSKSGECEWSIGWQPIPAKTTRRKDGVRVCKSVELFEVSPVLFGAAPLTRTLEVKALNLHAATTEGMAPRIGQAVGDPTIGEEREEGMAPLNEAAPQPGEADPADEATLHRQAMEEIDWDEVDAAADTSSGPASPGTPAAAASPRKAPDAAEDPETQDEADQAADEDEEPAKDEDAEDDEEDGEKKKAPPFAKKSADGFIVDAKSLAAFTDGLDIAALTGLVLPEVKAEGGADRNRGNAENLRRWYIEGEGAMRIQWGSPGDFMRCVAIAGEHMDPERAKGYCNLRHKDALGIYPAQHGANGRHGKAFAAADRLAKSWNPLLEVGVHAAHDAAERKFYAEGVDGLSGSFEARREQLQRAIEPVLRAKVGAPARDTDVDHGKPIEVDCWVSIDGTWPDRVVATVCKYGAGDRVRRTFLVPYTFAGDEVTLGKPQEVELQVSIIPTGGGDPIVPEVDEEASDAIAMPAINLLGEGITAVKTALGRAPEVKAGRVLSEANASRLRGALEHLLEVARSAGIDLPGWTGRDGEGTEEDVLPDTTAVPAGPAGRGAPQVKVLSQAEVQAQLTEWRNFLR